MKPTTHPQQETAIPAVLDKAFQVLESAKTHHLDNVHRMDEIQHAIEQAKQQKTRLEQTGLDDTQAWREQFLRNGAVLTDALKQQHMERVARRELMQECENAAEVLAYELEQGKGTCCSSAKAYRDAHFSLLNDYVQREFETTLSQGAPALIRAIKLKIFALQQQRYRAGHHDIESAEKEVLAEISRWLKVQVDQYEIRLNDEPVLYKIGLSPSPLPHMDYELAATPAQSMRFYEEMQQRKAQLQARGLIA